MEHIQQIIEYIKEFMYVFAIMVGYKLGTLLIKKKIVSTVDECIQDECIQDECINGFIPSDKTVMVVDNFFKLLTNNKKKSFIEECRKSHTFEINETEERDSLVDSITLSFAHISISN